MKDADIRKERKKNFDKQCEDPLNDIIKTNEEIGIYNTRRDSLIQIYNADSIRLINLNWENKLKIKQ